MFYEHLIWVDDRLLDVVEHTVHFGDNLHVAVSSTTHNLFCPHRN